MSWPGQECLIREIKMKVYCKHLVFYTGSHNGTVYSRMPWCGLDDSPCLEGSSQHIIRCGRCDRGQVRQSIRAFSAGYTPKDKVIGVWMDECGICHKRKPCTDLVHDWRRVKNGDAK